MAADQLDRLITTMAVRLSAFGACEVARGWRLAFEATRRATVHYVLAGAGSMSAGDAPPIAVHQGDMLVVPAGVAFAFGDAAPEATVKQAGLDGATLVDSGLLRFRAGEPPELAIVCGEVAAAIGGELDLFSALRAPIAEQIGDEVFLRSAYALLVRELAAPGVGSQALAEAVVKQGLVLLLRRHLLGRGPESPLFGAFGDGRLLRALTHVLERPATAHSVESLAGVAGMSRSAFAAAFSGRFGQGPMDFVRDARLRAAAELLERTDLPVKLVAASVGYDSRSYFSRTFRGRFGVDPSAWRERKRGG